MCPRIKILQKDERTNFKNSKNYKNIAKYVLTTKVHSILTWCMLSVFKKIKNRIYMSKL